VGERTSYESGAFSWVDLSTTDPDAAKGFYAGLFGWEFEDMPAGESMTYTMCRLDGKDVCALSAQMQQEREQGVPPHWNSYITAHDLDELAARVPERRQTQRRHPHTDPAGGGHPGQLAGVLRRRQRGGERG
jgi:predicted enzyme related to lactoylglutathione lyase